MAFVEGRLPGCCPVGTVRRSFVIEPLPYLSLLLLNPLEPCLLFGAFLCLLSSPTFGAFTHTLPEPVERLAHAGTAFADCTVPHRQSGSL